MSYTIDNTPLYGIPYIQCKTCGFISYHAEDIENKYCIKCHLFHEDQTMPYNDGRYDQEAEDILKKYINEVDSVLLVIIGKPGNSGFSIATKNLQLAQAIPTILTDIAGEIEKQTKDSPIGALKSGVKVTLFKTKE